MSNVARRIALGLLVVAPLALVAPVAVSAGGTVPTSHLGEFKSFWAFRHGAKPAEVDAALANFKIEVDERNGYLQAVLPDDPEFDGEEVYTFAVWRGAGDLRLFAFAEVVVGGDTILYRTTFWTHAGGQWTRRKDVVPPIDLRDFVDERAPAPPEMYRKIWLKFELPRVGTTIVVRPMAIEGQPTLYEDIEQIDWEQKGFDEHTYQMLVFRAKYESLELRWDKASGRFVKGAKRVKAPEDTGKKDAGK